MWRLDIPPVNHMNKFFVIHVSLKNYFEYRKLSSVIRELSVHTRRGGADIGVSQPPVIIKVRNHLDHKWL